MAKSRPATPPTAPGPERVPWGVWTAPAAILLGLVAGEVLAIIVEVIGHAGGSSFAHPTPAVSLITSAVVDLGFVAAALYFSVVLAKGKPVDFGFRRIPWSLGIKAFVAAGISYYIVTYVYAQLLGLHGQDKLPSELGVHRSTAALIGATVFVCVLAPVAEEFFFRGFLFGALRGWRIQVAGYEIGTWLAALVTGILFGLAHTASASPQYLIPLGFLGFVLCLVRWWTRSLYPCIALHAFNNALALGVNELHWSALGILGLALGSWLIIAAAVGPLAPRTPAPATSA